MPEPRMISAGDAILEATDLAMATDPSVFLMGEGVADPKGIFGTTVGLVQKYGRERVVECPIAENGWTGIAVGAALSGRRPIVVHQRVEFALLAMEQLANNAAKLHYVSNGRHKVPLVVRLIVGRGWGQGPEHSQSLETLFAYIPGLKVALPSTAADAKGMLLAAVADDNPVIFLEHRWIHYAVGAVPEGAVPVPLDGPRTLVEGSDVTIVASSYTTLEAMQAVEVLALNGVQAELIDLRVVRPLNTRPIIDSVRRTGRLVAVDLGWRTLGPAAEIVAQVAEHCHGALRAPPRRLGLGDHPTPSSRSLAQVYYPRSVEIAVAAAQAVGMPAERLRAVTEELERRRSSVPFDKPHPAFRGPF